MSLQLRECDFCSGLFKVYAKFVATACRGVKCFGECMSYSNPRLVLFGDFFTVLTLISIGFNSFNTLF